MTVNEFIAAHDGQCHDGQCLDVDGFPPDQPCQCVDVAKAWMQSRGHQMFIGNAVDYWDSGPPGFEKIANTPDNFPSEGDIVVWGHDIGPFGHVAIAVEADINDFTSFDQNFPLNTNCHRQGHNYQAVLGWLRETAGAVAPIDTVFTSNGEAEVRSRPGTDQPAIKTLPQGTQVEIDRWCHHPPALVVNPGWPPDDRWFHLGDGSDGWVASAVVHGDPKGPEVPDPTRALSPEQWRARAESVRIRERPSTSVQIVRTTGVEQLTFNAYCHAETVVDPWRHLPDDRWCRLADGTGWVANAVVIGDPPADAQVVSPP
jgi:hypothetical protein